MKTFYSERIFIALATILLFSGCQRDDICPASTQTTSLLVISFYDIEDRETPQGPLNLQIKAAEDTLVFLENVNEETYAIPLRTDQDITTYEFTYNYAEEEDPDSPVEQNNTDIIDFFYAREEVYLNRACSFKVNYSGLDTRIDPGEDGAWILDYVIEQEEVENENNTHISFYY
ncbi:DUF6452 family protein [Salegentibacter sp. F188]|uniref:DUF6452 family protein n=1 Tax=Autumnicola patrickiae TaxID=3075591 RepID=A0ABU3E7A3_9FLAO|nr:DUF6452 family protein [Salegentibacter sp. F188]MDT0691863.1 DUF6452 family protein [Salegentibacter sp. F188]